MAGVGVFGTSVCIATTGPATDDQSMVDAEYIEAASPANMLALLAHIDALHAVADELISFQAEYAEKAFEPGGMPGNEYYRPKLVNIVNMARAARGQ